MKEKLIKTKFFKDFKKEAIITLGLQKQEESWINLSENVNITDQNFDNWLVMNLINMLAEELPVKTNEARD
jgi:hypothetical protein